MRWQVLVLATLAASFETQAWFTGTGAIATVIAICDRLFARGPPAVVRTATFDPAW